MRHAIGAAAFAAALACAAAWGHGIDPTTGVTFDPRPGTALPRSLAFVDDAGRATTLGEALHGKPAVLVLGYLGCTDLCPLTLSGVAQALREGGLRPGTDYRALFVSIDPGERPELLAREKAARIDAGERPAWTFLASEPRALARLAGDIGYRYRPDAAGRFAHAAGFTVVTPSGVVARAFPGVRYDAGALAAALRAAGEERTGGLADRLLLLCSHLDPTTGRYTRTILGALRGTILASLVAGAFFVLRRRRRAGSTGRAP